jgi:CubicO group peptidase (beta-lactamase class C family)
MMRSNRLPPDLVNAGRYGIGFFHLRPGTGFGFDFGVFDGPGVASRTSGKGTFFWEGVADTWFWIDPTNDLVFIGMVQRMLDGTSPDLGALTQSLVYQALVNPETRTAEAPRAGSLSARIAP